MKLVAKASLSIPARPDESQDPGLTSNLVQACSFKSVPVAKPFLDPDFRQDERSKRRLTIRLPLLATFCVALAACNFTPVYGGGQGAAYANSGPIQVSEIVAVASSGSAPGRTGHFLRQELVHSIGQGVPGFAAGTLDVRLNQTINRLAFAPDQAASRSDYVGRAVWTLTAPSGDILGTGTVEERASFNFGDAAYADLAAQTGAQERLAGLLARSIRTQIILAAGKPVNPKTGQPLPQPADTPAP